MIYMEAINTAVRTSIIILEAINTAVITSIMIYVEAINTATIHLHRGDQHSSEDFHHDIHTGINTGTRGGAYSCIACLSG